jgi:hypothetical protein
MYVSICLSFLPLCFGSLKRVWKTFSE